MTDTPKMLTIMATRTSQSGKTLGVKAHDGTWYQTKDFHLAELTGQAILAMTSQSVWNDKTMHWINDYTLPEGQPAITPRPAQGPPQRAPAAPQPAITAQPSGVDRDASIVAQALVKSLELTSVEQVWAAYQSIYGSYIKWAAAGCSNPVHAPVRPAQTPEFDDDIPF